MAFGRIAAGFRTFRAPLERSVRLVMIPSIEENFIVGGRPPWAPLSEAKLKKRLSKGTLGGFSNDILIETGTLFEAATRLARWTITPYSAAFSNLPSRAWYGKLHQDPSNYRVDFPARPFVVMQGEDLVAITAIFREWTDGVIRGNWLSTVRRL